MKQSVLGAMKGIPVTAGLILMAASSASWAVTVQEAVQQALNSYPAMQKTLAGSRAIKGDLDAAKSRYLPSVDLALAYGREYSNNPTTRSVGIANGTSLGRWLTRSESSLTVTQTIFDGFSRESAIEQQQALLEGSSFNIADVGETLATDVVFAYVDVARHTEILRLAEENLKVHEKIVENVKDRVDAGQSGVGDLQQAKARQSSALARIAEVRLDLDKARINYNRLVGQMPEAVQTPKFDDTKLPAGVDEAVQQAVQSSPLAERSMKQADAAKALIGVSRANNYPTLLLEVSGSDNNNLDGSSGTNSDMSAMLRMRMNLYRGGGDKARIRAAAERHSEAKSDLLQAQRTLEEEVRRAWSTIKREDEKVLGRFDQVLANKQVVETYHEEFDVGQRDLLDLLDSENELFVSRTQLVSAESSALYARYLLLGAMGQLVDSLGVKLPSPE